MEKGDENYTYILSTLRKGQEKLDELKTENRKLRESNEKLVQLVKKLETILEEELESFDWSKTEYDYPGQWTPNDIVHEKDLELNNPESIDEIDSQISEAIKSLKRAQKFKNK